MTEQERDELLLELRDTQRDHGERLQRIERKVDAVDNRVSDLARAVREIGGDVADEPDRVAQ